MALSTMPNADDLARKTVAEMAPDELLHFDELAAPYLARPRRAGRRLRRRRRKSLQFGLEALTPVAVLAASALLGALADRIVAGMDGRLRVWLRRVRRGPLPEPSETEAQRLERLHQVIRETALRFGLSPERAGDMADHMISELVRTPRAEALPNPPE